MDSTRLCCLVSGGGRTVANLQDEIEAGRLRAEIPLVLASRPCGAVERLGARGLRVEVIPDAKRLSPEEFGAVAWPRIEEARPDLVCLCGFLRILPVPDAWAGRILNVHPALLPAFGGKGMYGNRVHQAALDRGVRVSGCTVHFADEQYDHGPIVVQRPVPVEPGDTVDTLAARIFRAECEAYPEAIRLFGDGRLQIQNGKVTIRPPKE